MELMKWQPLMGEEAQAEPTVRHQSKTRNEHFALLQFQQCISKKTLNAFHKGLQNLNQHVPYKLEENQVGSKKHNVLRP